MSLYREHIAPQETPEEYLERMARVKYMEATKMRPPPPPTPLPPAQIQGLAMAPGRPWHA
jgi:hypothetical protein